MAKRSIFEEVAPGEARKPVATGVIDAAQSGARGAIRIWLMVLFGLVTLMIAVGGLTRLTDSGLSITDWDPIAGAIPPLSAADWDAAFTAYKGIPEYELQNKGMSLSEFKAIYWWEWGHRFLGRFVGVVWALGFITFWAQKKIPPGWTGRLLVLGALGGLQGVIGWWMVASGLEGERVDVASYRLATHLGLAFIILGLIAWYVLRLGRTSADLLQARRVKDARLVTWGVVLVALAFVQILLGALVAGIDAGRTWAEWPLMDGGFGPPDPWMIDPLWRNFFENPGLVQWIHRTSGYAVFVLGIAAWFIARRSAIRTLRGAFTVVAVGLLLQIALGVMTVLYSAPWHLALLHQLAAVALWTLILRATFLARFPPAQSVRT